MQVPASPSTASRAGETPPLRAAGYRPIAAWLFVCCALVFAMVVVGGVTRLTHSGLSIVEWQPIIGTLPPLTDAQWQEAFAKYQLTPEYRLVNHAMTLHAVQGRSSGGSISTGCSGARSASCFSFRCCGSPRSAAFREGCGWKLAGIFVLGGLQGAMGWYMVKSGLVDDPRVSQFRLTAHLGLALVIFAAMFWVGLSLVYAAARGA